MTVTAPRLAAPPVTPVDVVIRTKGLTKRYGETTAVDALDLSIGRGEVFESYKYLGGGRGHSYDAWLKYQK